MNPTTQEDNIDGRSQERECSVGKSCGNTCIDPKYVCNSSLSSPVSSSLGKLRSNFSILTNGKIPTSSSKGSFSEGGKGASEYAKQGKEFLGKFPRFQKLSKDLQRMAPRILEIDAIMRSTARIPESELNRLRAEQYQLVGASSSKMRELGKEMVKVRQEMLKTSLTDGQIKELVGKVSISNKARSKQLEQALQEFVRIFKGKGIIPASNEFPPLRNIESSKYNRSYALIKEGTVALEGKSNTIKEKLFHEAAHIVESQRPGLLKFAEEWRNRKAFTEKDIAQVRDMNGRPLVRMGSVTDGNGVKKPLLRLNQIGGYRYGDGEIGVMDRFDNPYMGKVYPHKSTEVISIAMEAFSSSQSMVLLHINHPELFEVVAGLTR